MDENNVNVDVKKKSSVWLIFGIVCIVVVAFLLFGSLSYKSGLSHGGGSCDLNSSYNVGYSRGYNSGIGYAMNQSTNYTKGFDLGIELGMNNTILGLLHYAQNCSVVRVNYSNNVYGFIDATCVIPVNKTG